MIGVPLGLNACVILLCIILLGSHLGSNKSIAWRSLAESFCSLLQKNDRKFSFYCFIVTSEAFWKFIYIGIAVFKSDIFGIFSWFANSCQLLFISTVSLHCLIHVVDDKLYGWIVEPMHTSHINCLFCHVFMQSLANFRCLLCCLLPIVLYCF